MRRSPFFILLPAPRHKVFVIGIDRDFLSIFPQKRHLCYVLHMIHTFKVSKREDKIKDDELCMGVVYGPKMESTSLKFDKRDFIKLYAEAGGSSLITLEGLDELVDVTVLKIDNTPRTNEIHHVTFYAMERGVDMHADVPVVLVNEAPAEKQGAIINHLIHSINITCRPKDLIQEIQVDLSLLENIGDTIFVKDLSVPSTVTLNLDSESAIVSAMAPRSEKKEEKVEVDPDVTAPPEVEGEPVKDSE